MKGFARVFFSFPALQCASLQDLVVPQWITSSLVLPRLWWLVRLGLQQRQAVRCGWARRGLPACLPVCPPHTSSCRGGWMATRGLRAIIELQIANRKPKLQCTRVARTFCTFACLNTERVPGELPHNNPCFRLLHGSSRNARTNTPTKACVQNSASRKNFVFMRSCRFFLQAL